VYSSTYFLRLGDCARLSVLTKSPPSTSRAYSSIIFLPLIVYSHQSVVLSSALDLVHSCVSLHFHFSTLLTSHRLRHFGMTPDEIAALKKSTIQICTKHEEENQNKVTTAPASSSHRVTLSNSATPKLYGLKSQLKDTSLSMPNHSRIRHSNHVLPT